MEEQKMIVSKVDELMGLCDQLERSLMEQNELTKKIAGSLASEVAA
jgi:restriction endonuclease S subunit